MEFWLMIATYLACVYWFGGNTIPQFDPEDEKEAKKAMRQHSFVIAVVTAVGFIPIYFLVLAAWQLLFGG